MRSILISLIFVAGLYLLFVALAYVFQRNLIYFPDQNLLSSQKLDERGFEAVEIASSSGALISLWRAPSDQTKPIIIHFHGNAGSLAARLPLYQALAQDGAGVLAVGYPGYGGNIGAAAEDAFYEAAQANYDWLVKQGFGADRFVIAGQSLGSGVATWLASENEASGLILEAAFTGMDDMAQRQFPMLPAKLLIKDRYRSIDRIAGIDMPLSWIHGTGDELIPFAMGQRLFDAAAEPKNAYPIKNGGHNDLWSRGIDVLIRKDAQYFVSRR
ncbi:alpha/beta hydrolase [Parasphingorhabdus sp. JC815]|uniref:alpha/beta hydrolase n=1 Tax=Parasphingorhabdus sp. JC815 TaxID=3232140 RepID=UPI003457986F